MFSKNNAIMVWTTDDMEFPHAMKLASKYNIMVTHDVSMHGGILLHDLICRGRWIDLYRFDKELNKKNASRK